MAKLIQEQQKTVFNDLKKEFGWANVMQAPKIQKVVVSVGIGSTKDKNKIKLIAERLATITGQKPATRTTKQAIASYKTRIGDNVGYQVTLRGAMAQNFLNRLLHVALPRTKDFKGIPVNSIDEMGNYTLGIKEHSVFPETADEELKDIFGMAITIVTTAKGKEEAKAYFTHLGFPFKK